MNPVALHVSWIKLHITWCKAILICNSFNNQKQGPLVLICISGCPRVLVQWTCKHTKDLVTEARSFCMKEAIPWFSLLTRFAQHVRVSTLRTPGRLWLRCPRVKHMKGLHFKQYTFLDFLNILSFKMFYLHLETIPSGSMGSILKCFSNTILQSVCHESVSSSFLSCFVSLFTLPVLLVWGGVIHSVSTQYKY